MARPLKRYVLFRKYYTGYRIQKTYSENIVDYFPSRKNGMAVLVSTQKIFHTVAVRYKPPIERIDIYY